MPLKQKKIHDRAQQTKQQQQQQIVSEGEGPKVGKSFSAHFGCNYLELFNQAATIPWHIHVAK